MIRNKKEWKKSEMSRTIVLYCVKMLTAVLIWSISIKTVAFILDRPLDVSDVLVYAASAFGGELLLLAFKRIFAKKNDDSMEE